MVGPTMDLQAWLRKQLEETDPDLLREMIQAFSEALMDAEVDSVCNAAYPSALMTIPPHSPLVSNRIGVPGRMTLVKVLRGVAIGCLFRAWDC